MTARQLLEAILGDLSDLALAAKGKNDMPEFWFYSNLYDRYVDFDMRMNSRIKHQRKKEKARANKQREAMDWNGL